MKPSELFPDATNRKRIKPNTYIDYYGLNVPDDPVFHKKVTRDISKILAFALVISTMLTTLLVLIAHWIRCS